jgi:hypothetical protein
MAARPAWIIFQVLVASDMSGAAFRLSRSSLSESTNEFLEDRQVPVRSVRNLDDVSSWVAARKASELSIGASVGGPHLLAVPPEVLRPEIGVAQHGRQSGAGG